jgi:succinate dehydrogenase hydrophobic anchor subunit
VGSTAVDDPVDPRAGLSPGAPISRPPPPDDGPSIDWSGRTAAEDGSEGDDGPGSSGAPGGATGRRRLAAVAGIVSFLYIGWVIADLVVLELSGLVYTTMHEALQDLGPRLVLAGVWLALLYHGLDGLRVVVGDFVPRLRMRDRALRGAVAFTVFAVWIPTSLVLLWPSVRGWFAS